jgi:hypothetical protein
VAEVVFSDGYYIVRKDSSCTHGLFFDPNMDFEPDEVYIGNSDLVSTSNELLDLTLKVLEEGESTFKQTIVNICRNQVGKFTSYEGAINALRLLKRPNATNPCVEILNEKEEVVSKSKTSKKMNNSMFAGMNLNFGKLNSDNLALSMAGIAVKKKDGTFVVFDKASKKLIEVGDLTMECDFYQLPVQALQPGDLTQMDGQFLIVDKINADQTIRCFSPTTGSTITKLSRTNVFGMYFYTKVVSMFDMMNGGSFLGNQPAQNGNPPFNPMMLMMMMGGDKKEGMGSIMEMMMMSQMFGGGANPFGMFQPNVSNPKE